MIKQRKRQPDKEEEPKKGVKLTETDLQSVVGSGEFDDIPTVEEYDYDDDVKGRI